MASPDEFTVNTIPSLHGPDPFGFQVPTHHLPEPEASAIPGDTEHIPAPSEQPAWAAVNHRLILVPVLSFTHNQYQLDCASAFQEKAGVVVVALPEGKSNGTLPGKTGSGTVKIPASLHGP